MTKGELAESLFKQGYNCSQAVAIAFAEEIGMDRDITAKCVSGFGGGMGRLREVCGCFSGMVFVVSIIYGYNDPKNYDTKKELYQRIHYLAEKYRSLNGGNSIICRELLGIAKNKNSAKNDDTAKNEGYVPEKRSEEYYKKRPCAKLCRIAGDILEEYLKDNPPA